MQSQVSERLVHGGLWWPARGVLLLVTSKCDHLRSLDSEHSGVWLSCWLLAVYTEYT